MGGIVRAIPRVRCYHALVKLRFAPVSLLFLFACGKEPEAPASKLRVELRAPTSVREGERFDVECVVQGADGQSIEYAWSHLGVQPRLDVQSSGAAKQSLVAPEWIGPVDLMLEVTARVGAESLSTQQTIRLEAVDNPPTAEIASIPRCECGEMVPLTGQAHNERPQEVQASWRQVGSGPRVVIDGADRLQAFFLAPEHDGPYSLDLELTVRDAGGGESRVRHHVDVACDPGNVPLPKDQELELVARTGTNNILPRGRWLLAGSLELAATGDGPMEALLRFDSARGTGAALKLVKQQDELQMSTTTLAMSPEGVWHEPEFKRVMPLGPWPAQVPLGFEFESDGREVRLRFGPAGARAEWPELPFDVFLLLDQRPRDFAIDVIGGSAKLGRLSLRGM